MAKKFGLGRGLSSLIPDNNQSQTDSDQSQGDNNQADVAAVPDRHMSVNFRQEIIYISPDDIDRSDSQPRQVFEQTALEELVNSIKENGILEPLIVSPIGDGRYRLVAGERRLRAAKILGLRDIPAIVRTVSEQQRIEFSLIENVQRKDLNPIEEAKAYQRLVNEFNLSQEEVSRQVGKSRSTITNTLRLLTLPEDLQQLISSGQISSGHAKALLELPTEREQRQFAKQVALRKLSVRDTEKAVRQTRVKTPQQIALSEKINRYQTDLSASLNTKVNIKPRKKGGQVIINYYADEELDELYRRLQNE